jgi:hypothetical protein
VLDEGLVRLIAGAVAEVDPAQIAISRRLTPAQRVQQALSLTKMVEQVTVQQLCQQHPDLSAQDAQWLVRSNDSSEIKMLWAEMEAEVKSG